jgi:HD-GYP domain-containing protein (c-di-GMP phosphodiesterase class II)/DNA-binding LacI/PurR family transcriptional regulator
MNKMIKKSDFLQKTPLNIAFFTDWIEREYQITIMQGVVDAARRLGANLYCLEGGCLYNKNVEFDRNQLFELVNPHNIDGLIISSASVGHYASLEEMTRFCRQYHPLPIVSIAAEIEGCSAVLVDNSGLKEAITHLIRVHHCQKFALISGPQNNRDAMIRLDIFRQTLVAHHLPVDPGLIVEGTFGGKSGSNAVKTLLDDRRQSFDVIIAYNDIMALGALHELQARGIQVPDQVAIVGFDDIKSTACSNPPLTTINCFLYEQGEKAMELVLDTINNRAADQQRVYIPSQLVLRESCGCLSKTALQCTAAELSPKIKKTKLTFLNHQERIRNNIIDKLPSLLSHRNDINGQTVDALLNAFQLQLQDETNTPFLKAFHKIMSNHQMPYEDMNFWHDFLSLLSREIFPYIDAPRYPQINTAFHQVRLLIAEKANIQERNNYHAALDRHFILNELSGDLLSVLNLPQVMRVLHEKLPQLGINACYMSEYAASNHDYKIIMAYNNRHGDVDFGETVFSGNLMPPEIWNDGATHIIFISMIYCTKKHFYTLAIEFTQTFSDIYTALKGMIASSLSGVIQMGELHHQEKQLLSQQQLLLDELRKAMEGFVWTIQLMMEVRDPYTAGHQSRVSDLACAIAKLMNLPAEVIEGLWMAGIIHDLGKIAVPIEILNKPGRLKPTELALIKEHPAVAYEILKNIDFPWPIAKIVVQHHERLDGSGYPEGLRDGDILLEARILAVADVIEAMASHRPYRPALGVDIALEEIKTHRGKLYDNQVVDTCLELFFSKDYQLK